MYLTKKNILFFVSLMSFAFLRAQSVSETGEAKDPVGVPSSPTTYNFAKFGNIPQSNSTGAFAYSIPIYQIQSDDISHAIELNYYSSGVKIDEIASNVGMGFVLKMGGVISRVMRGKPDEMATRWYPASATQLQGQEERIKSIADPLSPSTYDVERDWFNFNVNGISGTFYFDENLGVHVESKQHVEVTYQSGEPINNIGYGTPSTFTIRDGKGYSYVFGGSNDYLEGMRFYTNCSPGAEMYYSAWFLREIISPNGNKMTFSYIENAMSYPLSKEASWLIDRDCPADPNALYIQYKSDYSECTSFSNIKSRSLSKISFNSGEVTINYNPYRVDNGGNSVKDLSIKNSTGSIIKTVNFNYNPAPANGSIEAQRYRLFLTNLTIGSANGNIKEPYSFEYYDKELLPERLTFNRDKYGYYNGSGNATPFSKELKNDPVIFGVVNKASIDYAYADLEVKPELVQIGMLKQINYPTGGGSLINYEGHKTEKTVKEMSYSNTSLNYIRNCKQDNTNSTLKFVSNGGLLNFLVGASLDYGVTALGCTAPESDDIHDIYTFSVVDITAGATIFSSTGNYGNNMKTVYPCTGQKGDYVYEVCPVETVKGHQYELKLIFGSKSYNALRGQIDIQYNGVEVSKKKIYYYGGARVKEIKDINGAKYTNIRKFYYNKLTDISLDSSSLYEVYEPRQYRLISYPKVCRYNLENQVIIKDISNAQKLYISSSGINQLFSNRSNQLNYHVITEVFDDGSLKSGAIQRKFYQAVDAGPVTLQGQSTIGMPYSNNADHFLGRLNEEETYKIDAGKYILQRKRVFDYSFVTKEILLSWFFTKDYDLFQPTPTSISNLSIGYYHNYIMSLTSEKVSDYNYDGVTPLLSSSEKIYVKDPFYNLQSEYISTSNGQQKFIRYKYASDFQNQRNFMNDLIAKKRVSEPVVIQSGKKAGATETVLETKDFSYGSFGVLVAPKILTDIVDPQNPKIVYNISRYTTKGKVEELLTAEGISVTYLWGYNGQYPIAEIKNATYSEVATALTQAAIDNLNVTTHSEATMETLIKAASDKLRTALPKAMITSYTYKPLVGMTSKTDTRGVKENYTYDGMQRLQAVLDQLGQVTKAIDYHYRSN